MTTFTPIAKQAGSMVVTISALLPYGYRVQTTNHSGFPIDAWSKSYTDLGDALTARDHAVEVFREYGTDTAVDQLRDKTLTNLAEAERRARHGINTRAVVAEATRVLDQITDLNGLALLVELRAQFAA